MSMERNNSILSTLLRISIMTILVLATIVLFFAGPRIEVLLYPVVGSFSIEDVEVSMDDRTVTLAGVLYKNRGECVPVALSMEVYDAQAAAKVVLIDTSPQSPQTGVTFKQRPTGAQEWGPWIVTPPTPPLGAITRIVVSHRCHFIWTTEQVLYEGPTADIFPPQFINGE